MVIKITAAAENNLKSVNVQIGDGLTVVTGVSGSGKTSLVFDTLYHEARRRFLDIYGLGTPGSQMAPAKVESITGLGPAVAVGQNLLNRNPLSTVATASGIHPFLRLLYARFGTRHCPVCDAEESVLSKDEIVGAIVKKSTTEPMELVVPLVRNSVGTHKTLLKVLAENFDNDSIIIDERPWSGQRLDPDKPHDIDIRVEAVSEPISAAKAREGIEYASSLGSNSIDVRSSEGIVHLSWAPVCRVCGTWFTDIEPLHFRTPCPHCSGKGCPQCKGTGLAPQAAAVTWQGYRLTELLRISVDDAAELFREAETPSTAARLEGEIQTRLGALQEVGLGYLTLDRPAPTLSRGEAQRVRIAVILTSRLEDMLHVLDEPTIGQHPHDINRLMSVMRALPGPTVFVEHDRTASASADAAIDLGPGAGSNGGQLVFHGSPAELWEASTATGLYFSQRLRVELPAKRPPPRDFLTVRGAREHNLKNIDVQIPLNRLTCVTGVSGSGKSTLVNDVLEASLIAGHAVGCTEIEGQRLKVVMVDQTPIGINSRSNAATYTKLSDTIRDLYSQATGLTASYFSFNRPEGACPSCQGMGAVEVKMRYLPSTWLTCTDCNGQRFSDEILSHKVQFGDLKLSIADFHRLSVSEAMTILSETRGLSRTGLQTCFRILRAMSDVGLGYLPLGQPSPTLSGGEAQRVKLSKYLGRAKLSDRMIILDEPSTGLHPKDLSGLIKVLDRLVRAGATVVVVEHNLDIIRAADWIVDLGPGAGRNGGQLVFQGTPEELKTCSDSLTGQALLQDELVKPSLDASKKQPSTGHIQVLAARANNLKNVSTSFPKKALTVVTGVSGSGKSSLVSDVLESEALRRFLESLSLYERQSIQEGPEANVEEVKGLGVAVTVTPQRTLYSRRSTVGTATEISHHLAALFAYMGERDCPSCGANMKRQSEWVCPECGATATIAVPGRFSPLTYAGACTSCHGIGTIQVPRPEKLILNSEKPLCNGAMYSPGFFPKGYLCKPGNGGYYIVQAIGAKYGFDPATTPWNKMTPEGQKAFLYGDPEPLDVTFESPRGRTYTRRVRFNGFYHGWVRDWDMWGTYTDTTVCPECNGRRLRPEYLAVKLDGHDIGELSEIPLSGLLNVLKNVRVPGDVTRLVGGSLRTAVRRLEFLVKVGLNYVNLNRVSGSLSAGEAQRIRLAGLLGSELTSLTIILDEPTRGLHPTEVKALTDTLKELRDTGNTVIVVEHDLSVVRAADHVIDMGPLAGAAGGFITGEGSLEEVMKAESLTSAWLRGDRRPFVKKRAGKPSGWMTIKAATGNNLKIDELRIPCGSLIGVCGVSGSGKSTLITDTLGRSLAPSRHTTSLAHEPLKPEPYESIEGAPGRAVIVDQSKAQVRSPMSHLDIDSQLIQIYAATEDAQALGMDEGSFARRCSACGGRGSTRIDMGFLPDVHVTCETCRGTGHLPEAWDVRLRGRSLPELGALTIDELQKEFGDMPGIGRQLKSAQDVGLGYLVINQPGHSLSGGEAQRLKIAKELSSKAQQETLYLLDEPTVGQHMEDVARLIGVLQRLADEGHTVIVVEHHPYLLASCDWLVELGPGGGPDGGAVVASGTPEEVAKGSTPIAPYLKEVLEGIA